jgi:uncharacterized membrane protein
LQQRSSLAHRAYLAAITIKGLDGAIELLLGGAVATLGAQRFSAMLIAWSAPDVAGDAGSPVMHFVRHSADGLAHASTLFVIIYLLAHGVLKLGIAINLLREKNWIFPVAVVVLVGFIAFMGYRLTHHWSVWLLCFALFDMLTLALVINEWRSPRTASAAHGLVT